MNLILLEAPDFAHDGRVRLGGRRARHIREVHRPAVGDELRVGKVGGLMGRARVESLDGDAVVLAPTLDEPPPPPLGIDLLLAMPRPKILRRVLQAVTSLGVKRIVLVNSYRVERSYFHSPVLGDELRENLLLGLEQGRDTVLPEVLVRRRFKPFVEDELLTLWPETTGKLLAHPIADGPVETVAAAGPMVVAVGPEGGWIPYEVELLQAHGFRTFELGPRILRVDTAVPFVIAQAELARRMVQARRPLPPADLG